jgi:MoxR-like ATPase
METAEAIKSELDELLQTFGTLRDEVQRVIVGHNEVVENVLIALLIGEHVLLEGVPGLGKTLLVRTLSQVAHISFGRIQFTPDLMPADITGTNIVVDNDVGGREFSLQKGPVFANLVLADEINRATPKTQSALLEAMQERSVTIAGKTHHLAEPFLVLATQNPLEMEGTYPLPEAQLDRFFFKLIVEYPSESELQQILTLTTGNEFPTVKQVCTSEELNRMKRASRQIPVADEVMKQVVQLVLATHPESDNAHDMVRQYVRYGASPRAGQALILGAKLKAVLDNRYHVAWQDIAALAKPALRHRILLNFEGQANNISPDHILDRLVRDLAP